MVKDEDAIKAPAAPEAPEGKGFAGWYIGETLLFADEDTAVVSVQPDIQYVYVEAVFADAAKPAEEPEEAASPEDDEQSAPQPVEALIYNGGPQALVTAAKGWLFSLNGEDYSAALPIGTDAGEYVAFYRSPNGETGQLTAAIAKADVMFTPPVAATGE